MKKRSRDKEYWETIGRSYWFLDTPWVQLICFGLVPGLIVALVLFVKAFISSENSEDGSNQGSNGNADTEIVEKSNDLEITDLELNEGSHGFEPGHIKADTTTD